MLPTILARPLTASAFAPYGEVLEIPRTPGRRYFDDTLANLREQARASLSLIHCEPTPLPLRVTALERHRYSSQSFVPLAVDRWLIVVAPHAPDGGPDAARAQAFVGGPGQGITYRADTWHHGLTVLGQPADFAIFMWRDGSEGDEEFAAVTPFAATPA
ncbi:ureidoglycolate lyase [Bordetella sp. 2513F-2]